jgi:hypothetical protein
MIPSALYWLTKHFSYHQAVLIKHFATDIASVVLGLLIGLIITAWVVKDANYVPTDACEEIEVTKMDKNGNSKLFVSVPKKQFPKMSVMTTMVVFIHALIVKIFPVKKLHFIDNRRVRIVTSLFVIVLIAFCIFSISFDGHMVMVDSHGQVKVLDLYGE